MLPRDIENLIAAFAWGVVCSLDSELNTLIRFRDCIPPCLLLTQVCWADHRYGRCLNPWYRGFPFTPFNLLGNEPPYVPGLRDLSYHMGRSIFSRLRTYPRVFQRHLDNFYCGDARAWNKILRFMVKLQCDCEPRPVPFTLLEVLFLQLETAVLLPADFSVPWRGVAIF